MSGKRWLRGGEAGEKAADESAPWAPRTLAGVIDPEELRESWDYVVVDEIVGDRIGLSVARWPGVDEQGRLRFAAASEDVLIGAPRDGFQDFVRDHRAAMVMTPAGELDPEAAGALLERGTRIGDVFAIPRSVIAESGGEDDGDVRRFEAPDEVWIYDISYEAREQAKLAGAAAAAPPLSEEEARRFLGEDGPGGDVTDEEAPGDEGPGGSLLPEEPKPFGIGPGGEAVIPEEQTVELSD